MLNEDLFKSVVSEIDVKQICVKQQAFLKFPTWKRRQAPHNICDF